MKKYKNLQEFCYRRPLGDIVQKCKLSQCNPNYGGKGIFAEMSREVLGTLGGIS